MPYGGGEWQNISNQYPAEFFRIEGDDGNGHVAETFGGKQQDKILPIIGDIYAQDFGTTSIKDKGVFSVFSRDHVDSGTSYSSSYPFGRRFDANQNANGGSNSMAGHADGTEIRPYNSTIRVWKRIS